MMLREAEQEFCLNKYFVTVFDKRRNLSSEVWFPASRHWYVYSTANSPHHRSRCHRSLRQAGSEWLQEPSRGKCPPPSYGWYGRGTWMPQSHKSKNPDSENSYENTKRPECLNQMEFDYMWLSVHHKTTLTNLQHSVCCHYHCWRENRETKAEWHKTLTYYTNKPQREPGIICVDSHKKKKKFEEQTVAWLEVSVNDFDWSFCVEVMHSCKVIKR